MSGARRFMTLRYVWGVVVVWFIYLLFIVWREMYP